MSKHPSETSAPAAPGRRYLALSFGLPFLLMAAAFALHRVYPFGDRQIMVTDFWQQYYPFLSDFWHKLREGHSLTWSWAAGAGVNYLAVIAYYLASPLNLLLALAPHALLREMLVLVLLIKIGCAGLFFACYLRYTFRRCDWSLPVFGLFYALCAFTLGYYWNIMWFDTFALLPLVLLGLEALLREGKFRVYVIALALAVFINYYIGLFICLFVAIWFLVRCAADGVRAGEFFRRLLRVALFSVIALGLTALLTAPAYYALQNSYSAINKFPTEPKLYENFLDIIGNFVAFTPPNDKEGLPNIYCGLLCVALLPVYLRAKGSKINWREKLACLVVLAFLVVSCNLNMLNYIWHGFHFTNMLPYRFSFLISFLMVYMAYRAFNTLEDLDLLDIAGMALFGAFVILAAFRGPQTQTAVIGSGALLATYVALFLLRYKRWAGGRVFAGLLTLVVVAEMGYSAWIGVETVRTTDRVVYPDKYEEVQELLALRENPADHFYRTETAKWYTINDSTLYGYDGVSIFSSTVNADTTRFLRGLGLPAWESGNRYYYGETSPLTNAFLNIRYLISRQGTVADDGAYWDHAGQAGDAALYENRAYLPAGFMTDPAMAGYQQEDGELFATQNRLFNLSTGLEGELFTLIDMVHVGHQNFDVYRNDLGRYEYFEQDAAVEGLLKWNYEMPADGVYYAVVDVGKADKIQIRKDDSTLRTIEAKRPYLFCLGSYRQGELVTVQMEMEADTGNGYANIFVAQLDSELFDRGMARLADEPFDVEFYNDTTVRGRVTAAADGLLYTSIPYEKGWTAKVDGVSAPILALDGSMAGLELTAGSHTVEFHYRPAGLILGLCATLASLAAFLALIWLSRKRELAFLQPAPPPPPQAEPLPEGEEAVEPEPEEDAPDEAPESENDEPASIPAAQPTKEPEPPVEE